MSRVQILTISVPIIIFVYAFVVDRLLASRKLPFYREMVIMAPGILIIAAVYGWLIGFSLQVIIVLLAIATAIWLLVAIFVRTIANVIKRALGR